MHLLRGYLGRLILAACLVFGVAGVTSTAYAQEVVVEGAHRVDPATVRSYFTGADQAHIDQGIKDLSATGMFSKVSARAAGGRIIVSVVESNIILNRVAFEGNSKIKAEQLSVEVQYKSRAGFNEAVATADIERIKDAYKKFGRSAAKASYRLVALPN